MYLNRAKKTIEQQDQKEFIEKRNKYAEREDGETLRVEISESKSDSRMEEFKPDELPDGSCFRPKCVSDGSDDGQTAVRAAEYIGSFSVNGDNQSSRAEFVQSQLERMHIVEKTKKVLLVISLSGVKVCSNSGESVYMAHALKRISYAACDPEHCQFAFLAREPKGHINIQFCHAFITKSPEEAEELNTIIGNAFKMAYAQQKIRQPTFNELIEKQLVEQKAKFAEYQEQANKALQQRLNEIATPTALQRMEMRRQSSSDDLSGMITPPTSEKDYMVGKNKIWAKHTADKIQHKSPVLDGPLRSESPTFSTSRSAQSFQQQSQSRTRMSDPNFSSTKRNSAPVQMSSPSKTSNSNTNSPKRNSNSHVSSLQSFQVVTIRESLESNVNNSNRFKGSPVTALKDEIDRRFSNGGLGTIDSGLGMGFGDEMDSFLRQKTAHHYDNDDVSQAPPPYKMQNRPLPAIPPSTTDGAPDHRASPRLRNWTSLDDDVIPHHTRSHGQARLRDSPKRRPQRPQSEVILDSKMYNIGPGADQPGVYIYGFKSHTQNQLSSHTQTSPDGTSSSATRSGFSTNPSNNNKSMQHQLHSKMEMNIKPNQQPYSSSTSNKGGYSNGSLYSPKGSNSNFQQQPGYDNMQHGGKSYNLSTSPIHFMNGSPNHLSSVQDNVEEGASPTKNKEKGAG